MNVNSAIEIYTTVLGWFMYDGIWGVLADAGFLYIPIVVAVFRHWSTGWLMQGIEAAEAIIRNMWLEIFVIMTVIALAGVPVFNVSSAAINHTAACGGPTFRRSQYRYPCMTRLLLPWTVNRQKYRFIGIRSCTLPMA